MLAQDDQKQQNPIQSKPNHPFFNSLRTPRLTGTTNLKPIPLLRAIRSIPDVTTHRYKEKERHLQQKPTPASAFTVYGAARRLLTSRGIWSTASAAAVGVLVRAVEVSCFDAEDVMVIAQLACHSTEA
jgi:hypothetical protein